MRSPGLDPSLPVWLIVSTRRLVLGVPLGGGVEHGVHCQRAETVLGAPLIGEVDDLLQSRGCRRRAGAGAGAYCGAHWGARRPRPAMAPYAPSRRVIDVGITCLLDFVARPAVVTQP